MSVPGTRKREERDDSVRAGVDELESRVVEILNRGAAVGVVHDGGYVRGRR